jgi:probable phosphomutase (TIGR03848 family)
MATLLLIRHGENDFVGRRLAGHLPGVHLNARGIHQAEAIAAMLRQEPVIAIYASPLDRTMETAEPLARDLYLPITPDSGLAEVNFGDWQGKAISYLKRLKLWKAVQKTPSQVRFPNGESFSEAQARVVAALEAINAAHGEKERVACFSHSDIIRLAVAHYLDMPLDSFQRLTINPASITRLHLYNGSVVLLQVNQTAHSDDPPITA